MGTRRKAVSQKGMLVFSRHIRAGSCHPPDRRPHAGHRPGSPRATTTRDRQRTNPGRRRRVPTAQHAGPAPGRQHGKRGRLAPRLRSREKRGGTQPRPAATQGACAAALRPPPRSPITWPRPRPRPSPDTHAQPARSRGPAPPSPARGRGSRSPPEWPLARKRARGTAPSLPAAPPHPPSDVRAPAERCGRSFPIARSPVRNLL